MGDYYDQYAPVEPAMDMEDQTEARPVDDEDALQDFVLRNDEQQSHGGENTMIHDHRARGLTHIFE